MRLLLAEDQRELANALTTVFKHNNYSIDTLNNGNDAFEYIVNGNYDCVILDIMLPGMNGMDVLKKVRKAGIFVPILILTAKSEVSDRITALDNGADDYLTKPFDVGELLARIRAITRRPPELVISDLSFGDISLSCNTFELKGPKGSERLRSKEFQIIEILMSNPHSLISTNQLMEKIWGFDCETEINVVWVYISYLRKKLVEIGSKVTIKASRGIGYTLVN